MSRWPHRRSGPAGGVSPDPSPDPNPDLKPAATAAEADEPAWRSGWYRLARPLPSPNFGPRPAGLPISLVVIHSISLPPGEFGGPGIEDLFTNRLNWDAHPYYQAIRGLMVSSHFVIRRDGELLQFVSADERAWHAGRSRWRGRDECNDHGLGVELEGLEGGLFEPVQYQALARLLVALRERYPIDAVAGHEHVAPGRKADPGPGFDWGRLQAMLDWPLDIWPTPQERAGTAQQRDVSS